MKKLILLSSVVMLGGCMGSNAELDAAAQPQDWAHENQTAIERVEASELKNWWMRFNDPVLNELVSVSLKNSPDRLIAEAKIAEARGLRRTTRSSLFPQIGASASAGREDTGSAAASYPDNFYEAGFDASFELDVFGKNKSATSAANAQVSAAEEQYHDVSLTLIGDVARSYIEYRTAQGQYDIAQKNLITQEKTLELIGQLFELGSAPKLDVERAANLVNTTRASLPEFARQADNARLRLSVLTGSLPQDLVQLLNLDAAIPAADAAPVLMAPAQVLSLRPDIRAAQATLAANAALRDSAYAELFPSFNLSGFYGVADNALVSSVNPWSIAIGTAVSLLDFGRIEGRIDAAEARKMQAYHGYRKTVLQAVTDVETALADHAHITNRYSALEQAYNSASKAFELSQTLYKEGEISFLDVLDSQRTVNNAESAMLSAKGAKAQSIIRLYKALGIY